MSPVPTGSVPAGSEPTGAESTGPAAWVAGERAAAQLVVVTRHRIPAGEGAGFLRDAGAALDVLGRRTGFLGGRVTRALDDPDLWSVLTCWRDVGSYRRALNGAEAKTVVVPLLSTALDEPSAFEVLHATGAAGARGLTVGTDARSGVAADASRTRLGEAAAPFVPTDLDG